MEQERLPRKLVAVLHGDVVGYSCLMGEAEDATHRTLADYLDLIATTVARHDGSSCTTQATLSSPDSMPRWMRSRPLRRYKAP